MRTDRLAWYIWLPKSIEIESEQNVSDLDQTDQKTPQVDNWASRGIRSCTDPWRVFESWSEDYQFLDTLSMHCAVAGLSSQQRGLWQSVKRKSTGELDEEAEIEGENEEYESIETADVSEIDKCTEKWGSRSSLNNLADAF